MKRNRTLPDILSVVAIEKGAFWSHSTTVANFSFYIVVTAVC